MGQNRDRVLEFHDKSSGVFEVIADILKPDLTAVQGLGLERKPAPRLEASKESAQYPVDNRVQAVACRRDQPDPERRMALLEHADEGDLG